MRLARFEPAVPTSERPQTHVLCYGYIGARTDTTQQSEQTPDKEAEIKNITVYVSGYTEIDTTGMLSHPTVWPFSVAADINSNVFDFYFLIWSLSRLLCRVGSVFIVAAALDRAATGNAMLSVLINAMVGCFDPNLGHLQANIHTNTSPLFIKQQY
jgi:hypothetical protein